MYKDYPVHLPLKLANSDLTLLQANSPYYHTRAMKTNYLRTCDLLLPKIKPVALRTIYRILTGDSSVPESANIAKIDKRIRLILELGDPKVTVDLREHNPGRPSKFEVFWTVAADFLSKKATDLVTAVDER
ncbi:13572_t:CDS:2 [Gigaspora margarita]|uniref:13572_t:CDS:1 n=1 Tax=Gigaspora margarita TaxID=4874 RepID=A0ABN7X6Y3_GIGMA|nr:13572_t:CDS:2 [Gigaspora margarita]